MATGMPLIAAISAADAGVTAVCCVMTASTRSRCPGTSAAGNGLGCQNGSIDGTIWASHAVTSAFTLALSGQSGARCTRPRPIAASRRAAFSGVVAGAAMILASSAALMDATMRDSSSSVAIR
ncbi:hypothetical protein D3C72_1889920 [compost metagenome]